MEQKKGLNWGYLAGIISGITYGMNPLFGVPVINKGLDVNSLLFYRYGVATLLMLAYMLVMRKQIRISWKQFGLMTLLGILFTGCSITLFEANEIEELTAANDYGLDMDQDESGRPRIVAVPDGENVADAGRWAKYFLLANALPEGVRRYFNSVGTSVGLSDRRPAEGVVITLH